MKITNQMNVQSILKTYGKNVSKTNGVDKAPQATDKVEISSQARDIQVAMKALYELPDMRTEKVEAIKAQIASGEYKPNADELVDKLMGSIKASK